MTNVWEMLFQQNIYSQNSAAGKRSGGTCASGGAGACGPRKTVLSARWGGFAAPTGRQDETPGGATPLPTTPSERLRAAATITGVIPSYSGLQPGPIRARLERRSDMPGRKDITMNNPASHHKRRQRLGVRPGLEPYYHIDEHSPTRIVLHSHTGVNARAGYLFMARGLGLGLLAMLVFSIGFLNYVQQVEGAILSVLLAAVCGGVLGWLAFTGLIGGWAIATTTNQVLIDAESQTIVYTQCSQVFRQTRTRSQTLPMAYIETLRLRSRPFYPPGIFRRKQQVTIIELVTGTGEIWMIDSAADPDILMPTATALSEVLDLPLVHNPSTSATLV